MAKSFVSVCYSHFICGAFHYYWTFYSIRRIPEHRGCPLCRPATRSVMTKTLDRMQMSDLNPEEFFNYCCDEGEYLPKVIVASKEAVIIQPPKGWKLVDADGDVAWDFETQIRLLEENATAECPNIIIRSKERNTLRTFSTKEELEKCREDDIANERWDDYFYNEDKNGDFRCSGYSMKDDRDSCYEYQQKHPETCRECKSSFRVFA